MKAWPLLLPLTLGACTGMAGASGTATAVTGSAPSSAAILGRYHWQLSDAVDGNNQRLDPLFGKTGKPLQLDFADQRVSVSNACNAISGPYHVVEGHLDTKLLLQTMMACMDSTLQQRETVIKNVLRGEPSLTVSDKGATPTLVLVASGGQTLTFTGTATAETRYAGPGETVFLEVAAQGMPCDAIDGMARSCLRVRERHYDANGLGSGTPGPWHALQQPIEDFTPQAGVHYVMRLKHYARNASSPAAYVVDTIVESGPAQPTR